MFIKHNVADEEDWKRVIKETYDKWGRVDVLVNNAGITYNMKIDEITLEDYQYQSSLCFF